VTLRSPACGTEGEQACGSPVNSWGFIPRPGDVRPYLGTVRAQRALRFDRGRTGCPDTAWYRPAVRRLLPPTEPAGAAVDPVQEVFERPRTPPTGRPWVLVNMISSADGAASLDGTSGGLGGPADKAMFSALRQVPDVILVAAGTVRAEGYRPLRPPDEVRARRAAHGLDPVARLAIVTSHVDLDLADPLFTDAELPPIVITGSGAPADRLAAVEAAGGQLLVAGDDRVDLALALAELGRHGAGVVLCEGGPSLLGQL
ncbi:hypothetical protein B7486_67190, partial [cyanobacterium TDX16]